MAISNENVQKQQLAEFVSRFLQQYPTASPMTSEQPLDIAEMVATNSAGAERKQWLGEFLSLTRAAKPRRIDKWGPMALVAAGAVVTGILTYGIFGKTDLIALLANPSQARGLITFLFSFGTISVVMLISIAIFWARIDEVERRVAMAKDVLMILIGIFGTILGFYFGSIEKQAAPKNDTQVISIPTGQ